MASLNLSWDVNTRRDHSGNTSRRPLPRPDNGDNVLPAPLWERGFCRRAYGITWENFCEKKRFIGFYKNIMDWDDSEAHKNFLDAKERFRAMYHSEPYEDPVLDPDMYVDEVDHQCKVDPMLVAELDVADLRRWGGMANADLIPPGRGEPVPNPEPTGWGEPANPTPETACRGMANANLVPRGWGEPVPNLEPTGWEEPANPTPEVACGGVANANLLPQGWGEPVPNLEPTGWGEPANPTPEAACGGVANANLLPQGWGEPVPNLEPTGWGDPADPTPEAACGGVVNANLLPPGWGQQVPGLKPTGWGEPTNPTPDDAALGGQGKKTAEAVRGARPYSTRNNRKNNLHGGGPSNISQRQVVGPGQTSSGTARVLPGGGRTRGAGAWNRNSGGGGGGGSNWYGGGRGCSGSGSNWRASGRGNQRIQDEGQHQLSGGQQQQGQGVRKMEWRPVQHSNPPQDDAAA